MMSYECGESTKNTHTPVVIGKNISQMPYISARGDKTYLR
jgi:hypothetical protein